MNDKTVTLGNGKEQDYYEYSNHSGQDLVEFLRAIDRVNEMAMEKKIPMIVSFSTSKGNATSFTYKKEWEKDENRTLLCILIGGLIKNLEEQMWVHLKFLGFGPPNVKS